MDQLSFFLPSGEPTPEDARRRATLEASSVMGLPQSIQTDQSGWVVAWAPPSPADEARSSELQWWTDALSSDGKYEVRYEENTVAGDVLLVRLVDLSEITLEHALEVADTREREWALAVHATRSTSLATRMRNGAYLRVGMDPARYEVSTRRSHHPDAARDRLIDVFIRARSSDPEYAAEAVRAVERGLGKAVMNALSEEVVRNLTEQVRREIVRAAYSVRTAPTDRKNP